MARLPNAAQAIFDPSGIFKREGMKRILNQRIEEG